MKIEQKYINAMGISLITVIVYSLINNSSQVADFIFGIFKPFRVFLIGAVIAFLLNPILNFFEKKLKLKRKSAILTIYLGLIFLLIIFIAFIVPKLFRNISDLIKNFPFFLEKTESFMEKIAQNINSRWPIFNLTLDKEQMDAIGTYFSTLGQELLKVLGQSLITFTYGALEFVVSFIMSMFFLSEKEYFRKLSVEVIKVNLSKEKGSKVLFIGNKLYEVFLGYFHGKTVESIIMGTIAFIGLLYFKVPYAVLLWVFITLTNFIPYFGPFLGIVVTAFISLFAFPQKVLAIVIFLFILQQFDSWFLEPKIIGDRINLKMFWGIAAITLGGSIAGPIGIILSAPLASFIKSMYKIKKAESLGAEN